MSELTGRDLDRAIAEALGLKPQWASEPYNDWWYCIKGDDDLVMLSTAIPRYHDDLNAVAAVCAERGWALQLSIRRMPDGNSFRVMITPYPDNAVYASEGATWAEAAARALYAALTAG